MCMLLSSLVCLSSTGAHTIGCMPKEQRRVHQCRGIEGQNLNVLVILSRRNNVYLTMHVEESKT
jgi:hypothetical protein